MPYSVFYNGELKEAIETFSLASPKEKQLAKCLDFFKFNDNAHTILDEEERFQLGKRLPKLYKLSGLVFVKSVAIDSLLQKALSSPELVQRMNGIKENCVVNDFWLLDDFVERMKKKNENKGEKNESWEFTSKVKISNYFSKVKAVQAMIKNKVAFRKIIKLAVTAS